MLLIKIICTCVVLIITLINIFTKVSRLNKLFDECDEFYKLVDEILNEEFESKDNK